MKHYKKIGLGIFPLIGLALIFLPFHKAFAAPGLMITPVTSGSLNLSFKDRTTITGTVNGVAVTYVDKGPTDTNYQYVIQESGIFCNQGTPSNITILNNDIALSGGGSSTVTARFDATTSTDGSAGSCTVHGSTQFDVGNPQNGMNLLQWQGGKLQIINTGASLTEIGTSDLYEADPSATCGGGTVAFVNGDVATIYGLTPNGRGGSDTSNFPDLSGTSLATGSAACFVNKINLHYDVSGLSPSDQSYLDESKQGYGIGGSRQPPGTDAVGVSPTCDPGTDSGCTCTGNPGTNLVCTTTSSTPTSTSTDTSACVFKTNSSGWDTALSWMLCPVINGLSKSADGINWFVKNQLNFSVKDNLSGPVKNAWSVFKNLASILIIILMLVMVMSQAIGGNIFDAYTIKKLLPKLVIAIIIMQVSWYLCIWLIGLANDAGLGIADLISAPFGGAGSLDLGSLLHNLGGLWPGLVSAGTVAGLITVIVFHGALLSFGWPVLLLAVILVAIATLVALATLLFRNALLVLLVITSPLAFLAWVLPGTQQYWKIWKDNFTKLLVFFPLVMLLIYGGRIFAWTAGNLGTPGGLDVIMVLIGFFGPYFFLPKTFKWGGTFLSQASTAINDSWPVKKGRESARKGLLERQQRKIDQYAKSLDHTKDGYVSKTGKTFMRVPLIKGNVPRTLLENIRAGRVIPTKRGLAKAIDRGEQWNSAEDAIEAAKVKREKDKAASLTPEQAATYTDKSKLPYSYNLGEDGKVAARVSDNATERGKAAIFIAAGSADDRRAGVADEAALKQQSWIEIFKRLVPVSDVGLQERIKASGAEWFAGDENNPATKGKIFVRMYDTPRYNSKVNASEDLYPLPLGKGLLATPHITNPEGKTEAEMRTKVANDNRAIAARNQRERTAAQAEGREPKIEPLKEFKPHHITRALDTINGYMDASNITSQSEAEFQEFDRLAKEDPDVAIDFGKLLQRIASGGQGGINVLTSLASSQSMSVTLKSLLDKGKERALELQAAGELGTYYTSVEGYLQEGQAKIGGQASPLPANNGGGGSGGGGTGGGGGGTGGGPSAETLYTGSGGGGPTGPVEVTFSQEAAGKLASGMTEKIRPVMKQEVNKGIQNSDLGRPVAPTNPPGWEQRESGLVTPREDDDTPATGGTP